MYLGPQLSSQPPAVVVHLGLALGALALGPFVLWARKGQAPHRWLGYLWVGLMLGAALSSLFIRDFRLPNLYGYTAIHLLTLVTFGGVSHGLWQIIRHRDVQAHQRSMRMTYRSVWVAAAFALLPSRYLGGLLWQHTLGLF